MAAALLFHCEKICADPAADKIAERYKQMLSTKPVEGAVLERLWKLYLDQGQTSQLIEEYKAGGSFASELVLGHLLRRAGRNEDAQAAYERAEKLDEKSPLPPLARARFTAELGKPREAAAFYEKAIALLPQEDPQLPEVLLQLGAQWLALGDASKAAEAWEKTVAAKPDDLDLRRRLADTYARNHLPDRAIKHLEHLEQHSPPADRALALQQLARIHQGAGDQDAAIAALERALALTAPGNWLRGELQSQLIRLHQRYHRAEELRARWEKYAAENPRDLAGHLQLVDLYERLGDLENERTWLEKLAQLAPKNPDYRLRLARLHVQLDQIDAAATLYDGLLREQPANVDFVFERARIDVQRDAAPAARERIAKLLEARKNDEATRAKALEFYEQHRLHELVEQHLASDAASGREEGILALANFHFSQRRGAEAARTLRRLVNPRDPAEKQTAALIKIAQVFKAQNQLDAAAEGLEKALALQPASRELQTLMGEVQAARGAQAAAQTAFQKAFELSKTPAEKNEADQRLFESFRTPHAERTGEAKGRGTFPIVPAIAEPGTPTGGIDLELHLAAMQRAAKALPSEQAWLRLARWHHWNRDNKAAAEFAQKALALNGKSIAAYELLVKVSAADGPTPVAVFHLMKLIDIDPANRASYQQRAGQIQLQAGRLAEALAIFEQLAREAPGNVEALRDLAIAQQRADRWTEALDTWRQVYALSPVSKKKDAFAPLLRVLERLDMHSQAAELQLKAIETEASEREQFQLLDDLLTSCAQHNLLDWLRGQFEQRRKLRADDYFTEMALGRILKATGNKAAAFEVLADASYAASNQAESLPELVHEAEELRKLDAAVKLQGELLRIVPQARPDAFEKLAQLQEKNFDIEEAAKTWDRIVAKFPRDTVVLGHAVDFQLRWGTPQRGAELLRKVRTLEPLNLKALATLADLDLEAGALAEAEACLEQILRGSAAEAPTDAIHYPALRLEDAGRLQTAYLTAVRQRRGHASPEAMRALRSFWVEEAGDPKGEREIRLGAIRQLAQLVRDRDDPAALKRWVERWRNVNARSEALWALYYAGAGEGVLDRLESWMQAEARDLKMPQAYIWLALQTGQFSRLSAWLQDRRRTVSERDYLLIALGQYLNSSEVRSDPALLEKLFPSGFGLRLWQTAALFATRNQFREAARLGQRVFDNVTTQRATYGRELAHWYLFLGEAEKAREVLRGAIATSAESFEADVYGALREFYLLLPEKQRPDFVESYLAGIDEQAQPLHRAIAGTVLRALAGDDSAARGHLDTLLNLRPLASLPNDEFGTAGSRRWRILLTAGLTLQTWGFDALAIYLWEQALGDAALIHLEDEQAQDAARELRQRLFASRVARAATPAEAQQWIEAFPRNASRDGLLSLGEALESYGAHGRAIEVYRQLWEREPTNAQALRNLLTASRAGHDNDSAEAVLWKCATDPAARVSDPANRDIVLQLADLLERRGETEQARLFLSQAVESAPADARLLQRLAQLHERASRTDLAEAVYRRLLTVEPGNATVRLALANLLEAQGRLPAALSLLAKGGAPELDARLAQLQLRAGAVEEALSALDRIPAPQHVTPSIAVATALAQRGERRLARSLIQTSLARTADPGMSFPLLCQAVELLTPEDGAPAARREIRRLRQAASEQPSLLGSYLDFARTQCARLGLAKEFAAELNTLWSEGNGPIAAGAVLLAAELQAGDKKAAEGTLKQVLARDDAGEVWLYRLTGVLEAESQKEWAVRVRERLARLNPANDELTIEWARSLHQLGRTGEARSVLEKLALRIVIRDDLDGKIAQAFAELGDRDRAKELFTEAIRRDPYVRNFQTHLNFARLQMAERDLAGAKRTLRTAFSNPANREFNDFLNWLAAADRLDQGDLEIAELGLTPARQTALRRALFTRFAEQRKLPVAMAMIEAHPETLTVAIVRVLRELAKAGQSFDRVATLLEKTVKESRSDSEFPLELARLYADWAASDIVAAKPDAALVHLRRAHELRPAHFEIARDLSLLQSEGGATKAAIETIESFLSTSDNNGEIDKAKELLSRVKAAGKL